MNRGVVPLDDSHEEAVLSFLSRSPYDNVFLHWTIAGDAARAARASVKVYRDDGGIRGVAFFGRQTVIAADSDEAVDAFADAAKLRHVDRMIVSPREIVERFWSRVREWHRSPRIVRSSQPLFAVDRERLVPQAPARVTVRRAQPGEWHTVARNSAQMIEHELGYDPRGSVGDFPAGVRLMIERGLWWVGEADGALCFFCNVGPHSPYTAQLQGIWTPPQFRGRGLATEALHGVCTRLLENVPSLSLYVNDFNAPAIALYERTGFARAGEFQTLLF